MLSFTSSGIMRETPSTHPAGLAVNQPVGYMGLFRLALPHRVRRVIARKGLVLTAPASRETIQARHRPGAHTTWARTTARHPQTVRPVPPQQPRNGLRAPRPTAARPYDKGPRAESLEGRPREQIRGPRLRPRVTLGGWRSWRRHPRAARTVPKARWQAPRPAHPRRRPRRA